MLIVQFTDETESKIQSWYLSPQDSDAIPNLGAVEADDPRWKVFYESVPEFMRECFPEPAAAGDVTEET